MNIVIIIENVIKTNKDSLQFVSDFLLLWNLYFCIVILWPAKKKCLCA